jgi:hypothetical protein
MPGQDPQIVPIVRYIRAGSIRTAINKKRPKQKCTLFSEEDRVLKPDRCIHRKFGVHLKNVSEVG